MEISREELRSRAAKIKWFFCDIDGTLTDGCVYYSPEGEQLKKFSLRDGSGFFLLSQAGIKTGFITTENSPVVEQRAKKLKIDEYIYGTIRKVETMNGFLNSNGLSMENIAYIGDEINDLKLLKACGLGFAVGDADKRVKEAAVLVCVKKGGDGAFREAAELLLELKGVSIDEIVEKSL